MRVLRFLPVLLLCALGIAPSASASGRGGGEPISVVATGLDSPRHLAFGDRGDLFIAESGTGGVPKSCFVGGEGEACWGTTGAVTKVNRWGGQYRIADGLPSMSNTPALDSAIGPHGITVLGDDTVIITNGGPTEPRSLTTGETIQREGLAALVPEVPNAQRAAKLFGKVLLIGHHGRPVPLADIYDFERRVNPDATDGNPAVDSNPVGIARDGHKFVVADAGGNALDTFNLFGRVKNLTVFPNVDQPDPFAPPGAPPISMQAVPTAVEKGPDGQYYMTQLTGFPFPREGASIWKVNPRTGVATVFASGFTNLMDLAFGRDGTLYALSIDKDGLLPPTGPGTDGGIFAVSRSGQKREIAVPAGTLPAPGGIEVGKDGLYVTINSRSPGAGQVLRIRTR